MGQTLRVDSKLNSCPVKACTATDTNAWSSAPHLGHSTSGRGRVGTQRWPSEGMGRESASSNETISLSAAFGCVLVNITALKIKLAPFAKVATKKKLWGKKPKKKINTFNRCFALQTLIFACGRAWSSMTEKKIVRYALKR